MSRAGELEETLCIASPLQAQAGELVDLGCVGLAAGVELAHGPLEFLLLICESLLCGMKIVAGYGKLVAGTLEIDPGRDEKIMLGLELQTERLLTLGRTTSGSHLLMLRLCKLATKISEGYPVRVE